MDFGLFNMFENFPLVGAHDMAMTSGICTLWKSTKIVDPLMPTSHSLLVGEKILHLVTSVAQ